MELQKYVEDLEVFVKKSLMKFVSEYYLRDPERTPGHILKNFIEKELEQVTFSVESAYITESGYENSVRLRVNLKMGNNTLCTFVELSPELVREAKRKNIEKM